MYHPVGSQPRTRRRTVVSASCCVKVGASFHHLHARPWEKLGTFELRVGFCDSRYKGPLHTPQLTADLQGKYDFQVVFRTRLFLYIKLVTGGKRSSRSTPPRHLVSLTVSHPFLFFFISVALSLYISLSSPSLPMMAFLRIFLKRSVLSAVFRFVCVFLSIYL